MYRCVTLEYWQIFSRERTRKVRNLHIIVKIWYFSFQEEVMTANDVPGWRFTPPIDVFANIDEKPEQMCFCPAGPPCAPSGTFNASACQYESPVLLSFPHFYLGKCICKPKKSLTERNSKRDHNNNRFQIDTYLNQNFTKNEIKIRSEFPDSKSESNPVSWSGWDRMCFVVRTYLDIFGQNLIR